MTRSALKFTCFVRVEPPRQPRNAVFLEHVLFRFPENRPFFVLRCEHLSCIQARRVGSFQASSAPRVFLGNATIVGPLHKGRLQF